VVDRFDKKIGDIYDFRLTFSQVEEYSLYMPDIFSTFYVFVLKGGKNYFLDLFWGRGI